MQSNPSICCSRDPFCRRRRGAGAGFGSAPAVGGRAELRRAGLGAATLDLRDRRGAPSFTLIELLVVIAVICILLAILLPGLRQAKNTALETVCRSQLHQLGATLENYRGDNHDWFPFDWWQGSVTWPYGHANYPTWDWVLLPYVGDNGKIFRCPADPRLFERTYTYNAAANERIWGPWRFLAPWCNDSCTPTPCWRQNPVDGTRTAYGLDTFTSAAVERPAETVAISELNTKWVCDYAAPGGIANCKLGQLGYWWHSIHSGDLPPGDNHNGGSLYLMVDAHVERKTARDMPYDEIAQARITRTVWWYWRKKS